MDARTRVRQFLARGTADRPPFLVMATQYTARLAQCDPAELLADPGLFVRSYTESVAVLGLDAILIEVPAALVSGLIEVPPALASGGPAASGRAVLRENLHRLRATLRDQIAIVTLLPGPLTLAASLASSSTCCALQPRSRAQGCRTRSTRRGTQRRRSPRAARAGPTPAGRAAATKEASGVSHGENS